MLLASGSSFFLEPMTTQLGRYWATDEERAVHCAILRAASEAIAERRDEPVCVLRARCLDVLHSEC